MTSPLPGWYQDPMNPELQKWWDGQGWTTYTMPLAAGTSPGSAGESAGEHAGETSRETPGESPSGQPKGDARAGAPEAFAPVHRAAPGIPAGFAGAEGARSFPGSQGYPGGPQQAYPPRNYSATPRGYTDPAGPPGYQGYQQGYAGSHPAYSGYPGYQGYPGHPSGSRRTNPLALTGFILGWVSMVMFLFPFLGTALGVAAGAFSAVGLTKQRGRAPIYKVFGIIGLVLGTIFTLLSILFLALIFS